MGTYLLPDCDTQQAMNTWRNWLHWDQQQRKPNAPKILSKVNVVSTDTRDPKNVLLSAEFSYTKPSRIFHVITNIFFLAVFEGTILVLPWIGNFMLSKSSSNQVSLLANLLTLLLCLSGLAPFLSLSLAGLRLRNSEYSLQNFFKQESIEIFPLTPPCSWEFFPSDALIIQGIILGLLCVQLVFWLGLSAFLPLLLPYLLIIAALVLAILLREYVYQRIMTTQQQHSYWKLEVTRLARRVTYFFLFPLLFYGMIFLLKTISFLLPLRQKTVSKVTSNLVITTVGYPNLQAWEQSTHLIINQFFQQIISGASVILTLFLLISFLSVWLSIKPYSIKIWKDLEIHPLRKLRNKSLDKIDPKNSPFLVNAVISFDWFLIVVTHITGALVVAIGLVWPYISDGHLIAIVGNWTIPFLWYQEALKILWGDVPGYIFSYVVVFLLCAPAWLWLSMWICSLGEAGWRLLSLKFSPVVKNEKVTELVTDLCKQLRIAPPIIRIDSASHEGPATTPILPVARFCVIRLPASLLKTLKRDELRAVLAHELVHVAKHARKIWLAKQLSRIAIFGSGYLTLQLNYWEMEIEADKVAIGITRDPNSLKVALEKTAIEMTLHSRTDRKIETQPKGFAKGFLELYQLYFGDNLWGAFHPEDNRLSYLQSLASITEDVLDVSGQTVFPSRKSSSRKKWVIAGVIIVGCVMLLFRNVIFPPYPTTKSASSTIPSCPAAGTVRPAVIAPFAQGNNQNIVYTENEGTEQAPTLGKLKRYDLTTRLTTEIIRLPKTWISKVQISADKQWILFNSQGSGQSEIQLVRTDGQKLQTLYCINTKAPLSFSWSPDPQWIVLNEPRYFSQTLDIINLREGNIRTKDLPHTAVFFPLAWKDGTDLFMSESSGEMHHSINKIDVLDISQQNQITLTNVPGIELQGDWLSFGFYISQDHKTLFTNISQFGQGISKGPGSITIQSLTGGDPQTIYATPDFAITHLQVTPTALIFVITNSDLNPDNPLGLDFSRNGLWKINIDGSGLTRLATIEKEDGITLAAISPNGSMYGLKTFTHSSNTSALAFDTLYENNPTVFASARGHTTLRFEGWAIV